MTGRRRSVLLVLLGLAGCGDPYRTPGTWQASGVNDANLAAMTRDKADLVVGHEDPGSDAGLDAAAVTRLRQDRLRPLRRDTTSSLSSGGGPDNQ